jgi:hypothetical protein
MSSTSRRTDVSVKTLCADLSRMRFGRLVVLGMRPGTCCEIRCDCGTIKVISRWTLRDAQSCGCLKGLTLHLYDWAERLGLDRSLVVSRWDRGWRGEEILTTPKREVAH